MRTLGELLRSKARTELLRALVNQTEPVGLRPVARLAGVHPHSAELALQSLVQEGLVLRQQSGKGKQPLYRWNFDHSDSSVLEAVFEAYATARVRARAVSLRDRAQRILPFIDEANRMLMHARGARNVS